jgi:nicotinamidase-related amidase
MNRSVYLVIDTINDFLTPDSTGAAKPLAVEAERRGAMAHTRQAIERLRAAGSDIAFAHVAFSSDYRELPVRSKSFASFRRNRTAQLGTWGTEIVAGLPREPQDLRIVKHRISAFYGTALEAILRTREVRRIYVSGITTIAGVQSAVRDAHDRDFEVFVIEDCCSSLDQAEHDASIAMLSRFCNVITSGDLPAS